ncbi:MAG: nickel-dependent lactate racemase [Clostridia bacterium]
MARRIIAWVLLIGFVLLILNIMLLQFQLEISIGAYLVVCVGFLFYGKNLKPKTTELELNAYEIGYGKKKIKFKIPTKNVLTTVTLNEVPVNPSETIVLDAIRNPIGTPVLREIIQPGETIAIITSDITRPMPSKLVLPILLDELKLAGANEKDITIVFALGCHRKHTDDEMKTLVGEDVFSKIKCVDGDMDDCINLGTTSFGTPIDVARPVAEADRVICLGNIEYHYFAGYSGGAKAVMPGVSSRAAIQSNHSQMVQEAAATGVIEGNPVRNDIEEFIQHAPIDFIVNVVLDETKNIVFAVAGDFIKAHRVGCTFLDTMYKVEIPGKADIVITTPGGYPKDINLYQAQKALDNAKTAVKDGGIIILVAACNEFLGEHVFEKWYNEAKCPADLIQRVQENFELGGHKAAAIAMILERARIFLVSDMQDDFVRTLFMEPYKTIDQAISAAIADKGKDAQITVMPYGGSTLPYIK